MYGGWYWRDSHVGLIVRLLHVPQFPGGGDAKVAPAFQWVLLGLVVEGVGEHLMILLVCWMWIRIHTCDCQQQQQQQQHTLHSKYGNF